MSDQDIRITIKQTITTWWNYFLGGLVLCACVCGLGAVLFLIYYLDHIRFIL